MKVSLKLLRVDKGKTIREVAHENDLSVNTVVKAEKDEHSGMTSILIKLYNYYGYELVPRKLEENE